MMMMMEEHQQKTDQIAYHFYTKLFSLVHDARVTNDSPSLRHDKWVRAPTQQQLPLLTSASSST
jgi:hypothetical protein